MTMKKITAMILVLMMVLALGTTAFADDANPGSITINDTTAGKLYDLYRIFDLKAADTSSPADGKYDVFSYTIASGWENFFFTGDGSSYLTDDEAEGDGMNQLIYNGKTYYVLITDLNVSKFAEDALDYVGANHITADESVPATGTSCLVSGLPLGYYLVYPDGAADIKTGYGSVCSLTTTAPSALINVKADYPVIEKTVDDSDVEVGQVVTFTVTGTVPDTTGYESYIYRVSDNMLSGLTFTGTSNVKVYITDGDKTSTDKAISLKNSDSLVASGTTGFELTFDMTKYQDCVGDTVTIEYTATVNSNAVCNLTENTATLEYSNNPQDYENTTVNPPVEVPVYSSKITVNKVDQDGAPLAGATFVLYKMNGSDKLYYNKAADGTVSWVAEANATSVTTTLVTADDGTKNAVAVFDGLESGDYYLCETAAPAGYNKMTKDEPVTVSAPGTDDDGVSTDIGVNKISEIENVSGGELPKTGGMGTTLFYVVGGILAIGAGILIITKKRMDMKN